MTLVSTSLISIWADTVGAIATPCGLIVEVLYLDEMSQDVIDDYNTSYVQTYPNATKIGSATQTYNCHSYAWNMVEGGPTCWINAASLEDVENHNYNDDNLAKYWAGNCAYMEVSESSANKIYYYNSDHSAIFKLGDRSKYVSKWGAGPLMEHDPGYGPYDDMVNRRYYLKLEPEYVVITGELVPGSGTYLRNQEYQFMQGEFEEDKYIFEWSVTESEHGANAIVSGKARLDTKDAPHIAKITFLSAGLFDVRLEVYDADEILVGVFTCQSFVQ